MCNESVERSTERHHASITTADVNKEAARGKLKAEVRYALAGLLEGLDISVWSPKWSARTAPLAYCFIDDESFLSDKGEALFHELLAIAYACAIDDDGVRAKAVALITRLEDEHVSTHLDAAAEDA